MSERRPDLADLEAVVRTIAEAVLRQLGGAPEGGPGAAPRGAAAEGQRVGWLLAAPFGHAGALLAEMGILARLGAAQRLLCAPEAEAALIAAGGAAALTGASVLSLGGAAGASPALAAVADCDLLYVGALAWHQARALVALEDREPAVALVLEALGAGRPVRVVTGAALGGLHRFGPERAGERGALAAEAARLWRSLAGLGVTPLGLDALSGPLQAGRAAASSFQRSLGGLLTEKDVEQAAAEGRRELRLPRGTVVTPLARDRARALGVGLRQDD